MVRTTAILQTAGSAFRKCLKWYLQDDNYATLIDALKKNFEGFDELHKLLLSCPKFGNNIEVVDKEARDIAIRVSKMLKNKENYLGNPFRPDFSSPSTHLTYGYWVGATPDGRKRSGIPP